MFDEYHFLDYNYSKREVKNMIKNKHFEIDKDTLKKEIDDMVKKYSLNDDEKKELTFIMNAFYKFYCRIDLNDTNVSAQDIVPLFDDTVLDCIVNTYNNTGLKTRANLFYKNLPSIVKLSSASINIGSSPFLIKSREVEKDTYPTERRVHKTPSHQSYSYGGCGGCSSGGSYGHC